MYIFSFFCPVPLKLLPGHTHCVNCNLRHDILIKAVMAVNRGIKSSYGYGLKLFYSTKQCGVNVGCNTVCVSYNFLYYYKKRLLSP